jgi:hypothetical protein
LRLPGLEFQVLEFSARGERLLSQPVMNSAKKHIEYAGGCQLDLARARSQEMFCSIHSLARVL